MPVKLVAPIEQTFTLDKTDAKYGTDGSPTTVTIRQATQDQNEKRSLIYSKIIQKYNATERSMEQEQIFSIEQLKRIEVYLTLVGCNILSEKNEPLFRFRNKNNMQYIDMTDFEFALAWGVLPPDIAAEIHGKVMEVNLTWAGPLES